MKITVHRVALRDDATLGVLLIDGFPQATTLELPWRDNKRSVSCIPSGNYKANRIISHKFGETYHVQDVPGRSEILLPHVGNFAKDTRGCVLIGSSFGEVDSESAIRSSKRAMLRFIKLTHGRDVIDVEFTYGGIPHDGFHKGTFIR